MTALLLGPPDLAGLSPQRLEQLARLLLPLPAVFVERRARDEIREDRYEAPGPSRRGEARGTATAHHAAEHRAADAQAPHAHDGAIESLQRLLQVLDDTDRRP